jgi:hypothetical protein
MTPDTENLAARVDRDRRDRERDLLALLLLLFWQTRQHVYSAVRVNADPYRAAADVLQGAPHAGPGLAPRLAEQLALAEWAGYRRTLLVLPGETPQPPTSTDWRGQAFQYVSQLTQTLLARIRQALATAQGGPRGLQDAIRQAFLSSGYMEQGPNGAWLLRSLAVTWTGKAYNAGYLQGWARPEAAGVLYGFEHVSTLDGRTSEICIEHDHTRLPASDPFWLSNSPPLHWNCRSFLRPILHPFTPTDVPVMRPDPGFGAAPLLAFGHPFYRAA